MKRIAFALVVAALAANFAHAGHMGFGGMGGGGFGRHPGGGDFAGLGGGGFDTERVQTRFESQFEALQADYDDGLAEIEDFYNSDEYTEIVDDAETLVDRYDLFLGGIERAVERFDDFLAILNDDLVFYGDLLAEYEAREDLSAERLERITTRLTNIQEHLTDKIETLTERQTSLTENLGTYQTFSEGLATYLAEIVAAGGGTTDSETTAAASVTSSPIALMSIAESAASAEHAALCELPQAATAASAVPEPGARLLGAIALAGAILPRHRPRDRRPT
jgi:hypothetical protein